MKFKVKICCIKSIEEAKLAIKMGASALGLVSQMPSGPGVISESLAAEIAEAIPPGIASFLLTCQKDTQLIIAQQRATRANAIQICEKLRVDQYRLLKEEMPGISLVQVIHVLGESSIEEAKKIEPMVNAILLDSGNPNAAIKELGGTGRIHNWEVSRKIRDAVSIPVFLAGGLNAGNIKQAIHTVNPFGVDVCSGVRTNDKLDPDKLSAFINAVEGVDN